MTRVIHPEKEKFSRGVREKPQKPKETAVNFRRKCIISEKSVKGVMGFSDVFEN